MSILAINMTQHDLTKEQKENVYWVRFDSYNGTNSNIEVKKLLTFEFQPDTAEIQERAKKLAEIAEGIFLQLDPEEALPHKALIGGAPYLMGPLEKELHKRGIQPMYSFSQRVSIEAPSEEGKIIKTSTFKHVGWIEV